jgi:hypothetical protein
MFRAGLAKHAQAPAAPVWRSESACLGRPQRAAGLIARPRTGATHEWKIHTGAGCVGMRSRDSRKGKIGRSARMVVRP